jgi:hypothetical protein
MASEAKKRGDLLEGKIFQVVSSILEIISSRKYVPYTTTGKQHSTITLKQRICTGITLWLYGSGMVSVDLETVIRFFMCPSSTVELFLFSASLANSMLLLSQTQAKSALALKGIVKLNPAELRQVLPSSSGGGVDASRSAAISHKERLRAAVRGALGSRHPHEADISDSQFLGRATSGPSSNAAPSKANDDSRNDHEGGTLLAEGQESDHNPVDEMYAALDSSVLFWLYCTHYSLY